MEAKIIQLHNSRAEQRRRLSDEEHAVAMAHFFEEVRAVAGSYLVAEYPLLVILDFMGGAKPTDTALLLVETAAEERTGT